MRKLKIFLPLITLLCLTSCNNVRGLSYSWTTNAKKYNNFTALSNELVLTSTITTDNFVDVYSRLTGKYVKPNSTSSTLHVMNNVNELYVGHSYATNIDHRPLYIVPTVIPDKYKTIGLTYSDFNSITYDELLNRGEISYELFSLLQYLSTDVFNENGLYISMSSRSSGPSNSFLSTGTNPSKSELVPMVMIPSLVALNCKTVTEAINYLKDSYNYYSSLSKYDVSSFDSVNYAFDVTDSTGSEVYIEFINNEMKVKEYVNVSTDCYVDDVARNNDKYSKGESRYNYLTSNISNAKDINNVFNLLKNTSRASVINEVFTKTKENYSYHLLEEFIKEFKVDVSGNIVKETGLEEAYNNYVKAQKEHDDASMAANEAKYLEHLEYYSRFDKDFVNKEVNQDKIINAIKDKYASSKDAINKYLSGDFKDVKDNGGLLLTSYSVVANIFNKSFTVRIGDCEKLTFTYTW